MKFDIRSIINMAKGLFSLGGIDPSATVERAITIPKAKRLELYRGMSDEAVAEAERDYKAGTKLYGQWLTNIATRGTFGADADDE